MTDKQQKRLLLAILFSSAIVMIGYSTDWFILAIIILINFQDISDFLYDDEEKK